MVEYYYDDVSDCDDDDNDVNVKTRIHDVVHQ